MSWLASAAGRLALAAGLGAALLALGLGSLRAGIKTDTGK